MKYRDLLINPAAPVESPSFSEWSDSRDGWEGGWWLDEAAEVTEAVDKCDAIRKAVEWMKTKPNETNDDPVVGRYTTAMTHFFKYGYQERRDKHLTEFKEMLECKSKMLALNPKAGKRGPGNTWVRGTGTTISAIKKLKPVSIKQEKDPFTISMIFDFNYTSSATIQSWSDSSADGIRTASRFSMMSKNNENRRVGMMITADIPPDQMLFSTTFTDTIKQRLAMNQEVESMRIGNTPLKVKAKVWFDSENMGARYYTVPYIESILNEVNSKDAEILLGWLDKIMR